MIVMVIIASSSLGALAQDGGGTTGSAAVGEIPTTGGVRPGPVGVPPRAVGRRVGVEPVALRSEQASVDAPIEPLQIINGVMQNPSGPFVVGWYEQTAKPGEPGNAVMAGHVDYWNVGPAIFWELPPPRQALGAGDPIVVIGEDGSELTYTVEWQRLYELAELTVETINGEIVGPTTEPSLTLITCGGAFDPVSGQYLSRYVVRATLAS